MMQITNIRYHDNGSPQAALPDFVRRFNEQRDPAGSSSASARSPSSSTACAPSPRTACRRCAATGPTGGISAPAAPRMRPRRRMRGQRDLDEALGARRLAPGRRAAPPRLAARRRARRSLALYAEHTWGADRSISQPYSPETRTQQLLKLGHRRRGREPCPHASPRRPGAAGDRMPAARSRGCSFYNPHPFPVRAVAPPALSAAARRRARSAIGASGSKTLMPTGPTSHRIQRQDVVMSDLSDDRAYWTAPIDVPALSYVTHAGRGRASRATGTLLAPRRHAVQRATHRRARPEGRRRHLAQARWRRIRRRGGRTACGSACRCSSGPRPASATRSSTASTSSRPTGTRPGTPTGRRAATCRRARRNTRHRRHAAAPRSAQTFALPEWRRGRPSSIACCRTTRRWRSRPSSTRLPLAEPARALPADARRRSAHPWTADFETGGAVVELDDEQLPYASRHYITTQRFIRIADDEARADGRPAPTRRSGRSAASPSAASASPTGG